MRSGTIMVDLPFRILVMEYYTDKGNLILGTLICVKAIE
jgi:hypothetical protein